MKKAYKSLQDEGLREHNIVALYKLPNLQSVVEALRLGFLNKEMPKIDDRLVKRAKTEAQALNKAYDGTMYAFAQALYRYAFFQGATGRIDGSLLGISGSIEGHNNIGHTVLSFDLGSNPWEVYKGQNLQKSQTLDTVLVSDKTNLWAKGNLDMLHGFNKLMVARSGIFFPSFAKIGRESDNFFNEDGLNLDDLVPHLMWTGGYIGYTPVLGKYPTREEFAIRAPQSISYRLKNSSMPRLAQLIVSERGLFQDLKETLADVAAVRAVLDGEEDVCQFVAPFSKAYHENTTIRIGRNYVVDIIYIDDRFGVNKKPNGFQDYKMAIRISQTKKAKDSLESGLVVEMQVTDKMSFYNHEIDESHPAHHIHRENERKLLMPTAKDRNRKQHVMNTTSSFQIEIADYVVKVLDKIFPPYIMTIDIDALRR